MAGERFESSRLDAVWEIGCVIPSADGAIYPWLEREDIGVSTQEVFPMRCLIIGIGTVDTVMVR